LRKELDKVKKEKQDALDKLEAQSLEFADVKQRLDVSGSGASVAGSLTKVCMLSQGDRP
jgi:hypothetical protein